MKKSFYAMLLAAAAVLISATFQSASAQKFKVGDNVVALGIGLGSTYGFTSSSSTPAFSLQYEHGMWDVGGPGTISLGGFLAYKRYSYEGAFPYYGFGYTYSQKWSYTIIGFRSAYHYNGFDAPKFDPYGGAMLSYEIVSSSYTSNNPTYDYLYSGTYGSTLRFTLFLGGRYYFSDAWAGFAEVGFGNAILTIGAAYKFSSELTSAKKISK